MPGRRGATRARETLVTSAAGAVPGLWIKAAVFALLFGNIAIYVYSGSLSEAIDSAAWLTLLVLFELETDFADRFGGRRAAGVIRAARLAAGVAVCAAAIGYLREEEWLDAINSGLWIGIVVLLEIQVRYARALTRYRAWFAAGAAAFYAGLGAMVLVWLWQREWFDAYDALLWLTALLIIEFDVLQSVRRARPAVA